MFQQLKPLVAKSPIAMNVVAEGELLRVTIAQKTSRRGAPLNISVLASAEDLDRDLPGEIDKAANQAPAPAPIADQVKAQAPAVPSAKPKQASPAARPAKKAKSAKTPRVSKPKPQKQAKTPKAAARNKIRLPGTRRAAKPSPQASRPSSDGIKHQASKPGKEQCIADYKQLKATLGEKFNRETFIKKADTGRRFERLWDMSWQKFVADAERAIRKAVVTDGEPASVERDTRTADLFDAAAKAAKKREPAPGHRPTLPGTWPFPTGLDKTEPAAPPAVPEKRTTEAPTASATSAPAPVADPVTELVDTSKPHPPRVVKEKAGKLIAGGYTEHVMTGRQLAIGGGRWTVVEYNERYVIVEESRGAGTPS